MSQWFDTSKGASDGENRVTQSQETSSSSRSANEPSLQNNKPVNGSGENAKYTFICECFFMTARVLNLGLLKAFSDFKHLVQVTIPSLLIQWDMFCINHLFCFQIFSATVNQLSNIRNNANLAFILIWIHIYNQTL